MVGVRAVLAAAVEAVAALYDRHPDPRPSVLGEGWTELETEIDAAFAAGDRPRALAATREWRRHAETVLTSEARPRALVAETTS